MMSEQQQNSQATDKLLVIVGQTATGKSALALDLAERLGGEIICADSRTVYKEMTIGTAKPSAADQARVPHWGLDLVSPSERFTVADFKTYANRAIRDIQSRGKLPIMVGGSGLYIDAVLYDFQLRPVAEPALRAELEALSVDQLQARLAALGLPLPENARNPRYLMRAIETADAPAGTGARSMLRSNTTILGLELDRDILAERITARVEQMVADGLVAEITQLASKYGWDVQALQAPGFRAFRKYIEGAETLDEAKAEFVRNDRALAKRQRTWFRRNKSIHWLVTEDKLAEAVDIATTLLDT